MRNLDGLKRIYMNKWFLLVVCSILFLIIGAGIGENEAKFKVGDKEGTYEELVAGIKDKEEQIEKIDTELESLIDEKQTVTQEVNENKELIEVAKDYSQNKEALDNQLQTLTSQISTKNEEIKQLDSQISSKQDELASLTGQIQETGEAPIELGAGFYYFGKDIPPGRYDLQPQPGQYGNVFVRGLNGISKVGETFGRDELQSFIFEGLEGEEIEATIPIILVPVE